jgi:hypothetical protein
VERGQDLLVHGLHWNGSDIVVPARLQDALGVGAIRLVAANVGTDVVRRQQQHLVAEPLDFTRPVVSRTTRFHYHRGRRLLRQKGQELMALRTLSAADPTGPIRDRDLESGLCHIHGDASIVRHDGLLLLL